MLAENASTGSAIAADLHGLAGRLRFRIGRLGSRTWKVLLSSSRSVGEINSPACYLGLTVRNTRATFKALSEPSMDRREIAYCRKHVEVATPLLISVAFIVGLLGLALILGGIYLGFLSRIADTQMSLLGMSIKSTSVAIAMAFLGTVLVVRAMSRTLKSIEVLAALPPDETHSDPHQRRW